jgi:hypothetical protein
LAYFSQEWAHVSLVCGLQNAIRGKHVVFGLRRRERNAIH